MTNWNKVRTAILAACLLVGSGSVNAQSSIGPGYPLYDYVQARASRLQGLDNYVVRIKSISFAADALQDESCLAAANCQVFDVVADVPMVGRIDRQMSPLEVMALTGTSMDADTMEVMGGGFLLGQEGLNEAATGSTDPTGGLAALSDYFSKDPEDRDGSELEDAGGNRPWLDPFSMIGAGGMMMMDASEGMRDAEDTVEKRDEIAADMAQTQAAMMAQLEPLGEEDFGGVRATRYGSTAPPASMGVVENQEVIARSTNVWVDHDRNLMLGHRLEGTMIENGESRDFYIQSTSSDFRNPPGCFDLVQPYKRTMEMGGILNDEQKAQMEEAQKQLAEFDQQMAQLPPAQRQMMESMMGSQMETVRNMAETGTLSHTMEVEEIICNADLKALFSPPVDGPGLIQPTGDGLLVQIQTDLTTLGYEPGNTNGVLDTMTQVAISQFEAEAGLPVTGEPSQQVANALAAAVGR